MKYFIYILTFSQNRKSNQIAIILILDYTGWVKNGDPQKFNKLQ